MNTSSIGSGTTVGFFESEFELLDLKDKRLERMALKIFEALQIKLTCCVRRLCTESQDTR